MSNEHLGAILVIATGLGMVACMAMACGLYESTCLKSRKERDKRAAERKAKP